MNSKMTAMLLEKPGERLAVAERQIPRPLKGQLLVEVFACAVCRTDLHVVDGELHQPKLPLIPGHEIVGRVRETGPECSRFAIGDRVGIPWLGWTCGECEYCLSGRENLCDRARFTGYTIDGGYAEFTTADERYCFPIPDTYDDVSSTPLLCAGLIGYRSLRKAGDASILGVYGFGAAAHIVVQIARHEGRTVYAFTRPGDAKAQEFASSLGAAWAGSSEDRPPRQLDAAIIFAPVGALVPAALTTVRKGGIVVCGGIHMSDIPSFPYEYLWGERQIVSVANLTRRDAEDFMTVATRFKIVTHVQPFPLRAANEALDSLRYGRLQGAAVLVK
jgi:propanol-preferring alcohol dehydrogenase